MRALDAKRRQTRVNARARAALQATGRDVVVKGTEAMPVGRIVELDEGNEWVLGEMDK